MKKIAKINLEHLQNEEWYTYVNTLFQLINEHSAAKDFLMPMLGLLEKSYNDANASLEVIRGSQLSKEIDEADILRDRMIGSLNNFVRSFLYDANADKRKSAEALMLVINHYSDMPQAPQDQESGMIVNFIEELESNHEQHLKAIGLEDRVLQLKQANANFMAQLSQRTREAGHKPARRMVDVRREGNRIIRLMYSQIEMLLLTETSELAALTQFANELNAENSRVSANLNRKGKRDSGETENEELKINN